MLEARAVIPRGTARISLAAVLLVAGLAASSAAASEREASKLAESQLELDEAEAQVATLERQQADTEPQLAAVQQRFQESDRAASKASARAKTATERLREEWIAAAEEVAAADSAYDADRSGWLTTRGFLIALGAFLLAGALLAASWGQRASSGLTAWMSRQETVVHATIVAVTASLVIAGLVGVIAAESSGVAVLSGCLLGVSVAALLGLLVALSTTTAEAPGAASPSRQNAGVAPRLRTTAMIAGLAGGIAAIAVAAALSAPERATVDPVTHARAAAGDPSDSPTPELTALLEKEERRVSAAGRAETEFDQLKAQRDTLQEDLGDARSKVSSAEREVAKWEAALAKPDPVEAPPESISPPDDEPDSGCDPGYSGCVPPYPPDVDCADVGGPVQVYGSDPHGLDADNDGEGCES